MPLEFIDGEPESRVDWKYDWDKITGPLKSHPGKWAVITSIKAKDTKSAALGTARRLREGKVPNAEPGEFEATIRGKTVYARYVGLNPDKQ